MKTRLYLDVDGVINARRAGANWPGGIDAERRRGFLITYAPEMIDELRKFNVDLVWATTWAGYAAEDIGGLINLGQSARHLERRGIWPSILWKIPAVAEDQRKSPSPLIWIDDEMLLDDTGEYEFDSLLIRPHPSFGITPDHIEQMKEFIERASDAGNDC